MKAWFIFDVDGKRVGVFTNSAENGEKSLRKVYGNELEIKFVDIDWFNDAEYERLHIGMSSVDTMIASGLIGNLSKTFRSL